jgi:hypothetical protein
MRRRAGPQERREKRQVFGRGGTATRYKMREKAGLLRQRFLDRG